MNKFFSEWKGKSTKERGFMIAGAFALVLAVIGVFLPVVPQVPFAILAAYLFSKGSPKIHKWIRKNKHFGKPVRDWEDHRSVSPKMKIVSSIMMLGGAAIGHWKLPLPWALALDGVFLLCIVFVCTRKNAK